MSYSEPKPLIPVLVYSFDDLNLTSTWVCFGPQRSAVCRGDQVHWWRWVAGPLNLVTVFCCWKSWASEDRSSRGYLAITSLLIQCHSLTEKRAFAHMLLNTFSICMHSFLSQIPVKCSHCRARERIFRLYCKSVTPVKVNLSQMCCVTGSSLTVKAIKKTQKYWWTALDCLKGLY